MDFFRKRDGRYWFVFSKSFRSKIIFCYRDLYFKSYNFLAFLKFGKDFTAIANEIGTKSVADIKRFYVNFGSDYRLDFVSWNFFTLLYLNWSKILFLRKLAEISQI